MTTANKSLNQPTYNSYVNTWGTGPLNDNFGNIDLALGGSTLLNATGLGGTTVVLTANQCIPLTISVSGSPGGIVTYSVPAGIGGQWIVRNGVADSSAIRIQSAAGGTYVSIAAGDNVQVSCDGSATGMVRNSTAAAGAAGSNTQVQFNSSGVLAGSANMTFDGTTLSLAGLSVTGGTVLGDAAGDALTVNSNAMAIPNTLNIGSNTLYLSPSGAQVGIGTTTVGSDKLVVAGTIKSTSGGFVFPDSSTQTTSAALPPGVIVPYGAASAPSGWLLCGGQAVSRTTNAALFAVIGTTYGVGDGSTTFNLPDLRGRVVAGVDNMNGSAANRMTGATMSPDGNSIGATGGAQQVTLSTSEIPSHNHTASDSGHTHSISQSGLTGNNSGLGGTGGGSSLWQSGSVAGATNVGTANISVGNTGGGGAHLNAQPTILLYYIIKT